jgi:hypothetical protein
MKTKNKRFRKTKCNKSRKTKNKTRSIKLNVTNLEKTLKNKDYNGGMWSFTKRSNNPSEPNKSSWFSWFSRPKKQKQEVTPPTIGIDSKSISPDNLEDHLSEEDKSKLFKLSKLSEPEFSKLSEPELSELFKLFGHCLDSNFCITYTREHNAKVLSYFDNFKILPKYLKESKQIGAVSVNGIIFAVIYKKNGYVVNAVFKCPKISEYRVTDKKYRVADNLFYEYRVGVDFINDMLNYYPCFLETYGMYEGVGAIKDASGNYSMNKNCKRIIDTYADTNADTTLENSLFKRDSLKTNILTKFNNINILIQYLNNPISFEHFLTFNTPDAELPSNQGTEKKKGNTEFELEVYNILFQIYSVLAALGNRFTHYDLHWNNVQLHKVENDKYIDLIYYDVETNENGAVLNATITPITIHTQYIVKILDYGRCYYNNPFDASKNSVEFYNKICEPNNCTYDNGLHWLQYGHTQQFPQYKCNPGYYTRMGETCSTYPNKMFDTRLIAIIREFTNVVDTINKYNSIHGIYAILKSLKSGYVSLHKHEVIGIMHIHLDRSEIMKFIKSSNVNTN